MAVQGKTPGAIPPEVMAEYIRCYRCLGTIRVVCEDYRAAAGVDLDDDRESDNSNTYIQAPLLTLWGGKGTVGHPWDVLETWRAKADNTVSGRGCG